MIELKTIKVRGETKMESIKELRIRLVNDRGVIKRITTGMVGNRMFGSSKPV